MDAQTLEKYAKQLTNRWPIIGAKLSEGDLLKRLETAPPAEGVPLAAALAEKTTPNSAAAKKVLESPHWLVRPAGHACGLSQDLARDTVDDTNHWVRELSNSTAVLELWPALGTPAEAWTGKLGSARRALRPLLQYRVVAPEGFEDVIIGGTEFDLGGLEEA